MGQFANTLFSLLLGWVQAAASGLWSLATNAGAGAWLHWVLEHWLALTLWLCIGGLAIDFAVYLFRWQPYRVWGRFLRRHKEVEEEAAQEEQQPLFQRKWVYADGTTQVEEVRKPEPRPVEITAPLDAPIRPRRRMARRATPEQSYGLPVYPPQWHENQEQGENDEQPSPGIY